MDTWALFIGIKGEPRRKGHGQPPNGWWRERGSAQSAGPPLDDMKKLAARSSVKCSRAVGASGEARVYKTGTSFQVSR